MVSISLRRRTVLKKLIHLALIGIFTFLFVSPTLTTHAQDPEPWIINVNDTRDLPDFAQNSVCDAEFNTPGEQCTLRAAIHEANLCTDAECPGGVIIQVPYMAIWLTNSGANEDLGITGDLDIHNVAGKQIVIEGLPGGRPLISGNGQDRIFDILGGPVVLRNLWLVLGRLEATETNPSPTGAGIRNSGILELSDVVIEDNQINCLLADQNNCYQAVGGGIVNYGTLTINMSTIRLNKAARGGGIFQTGSAGDLRIYNTSFYDNIATQNGGGLVSYSTTSIINSTISNNNALQGNGGIINNAILYLANVTIASNSSNYGGGANLANEGTLNIRNSIIAYPNGPLGVANCQSGGTWNSSGYNLYSDASCSVSGSGDLSNTDPKLTELMDWGGWNWTRGLLQGSPAHDRRPGFCTEFNTGYTVTTDQRGQNRDAMCDIGAFEGMISKVYLPAVRR